jgi:hypothetical protein
MGAIVIRQATGTRDITPTPGKALEGMRDQAIDNRIRWLTPVTIYPPG